MKLTGILLLAGFLQVGAHGKAQTVTYAAQQVPLPELFTNIERQTGYVFFYDKAWLEGTRPVTVVLKATPLREALELVLSGQPIGFEIREGNTILLTRRTMLTIVVPYSPIRGRVVDADGKPLQGATVMGRNARGSGASSNADGSFTVDVKEGDVLVISFVGYASKEVRVTAGMLSSSQGLTIVLEQKKSDLNEIVINKGYYSESKLLSTSSVVRVDGKDIERQPVTSLLLALQGRVPGLDIKPNSGAAGSAVKAVIRGQNSISNINAYPLYIIDGIPVDASPIKSENFTTLQQGGFDPLTTINPANIASIEVLKDADATAIYGARGANGVILITTRRGTTTGQTDVDLRYSTGAGKEPYFLKLLDTKQYLAMRREAFRNEGRAITADWAPDLLIWDTTRYTDWQKVLLGGTANITDVQANVSGGSRQTSFRFGASYHKEGMITPGDFGYQRVTGNISINHSSSNQRFKASLNMNYGWEHNKLFNNTLVQDLHVLTPVAPPLYDSTGKLNWANGTWYNPLAGLNNTDNNRGSSIGWNASLGYELLPGLTARVNMGYTALDNNDIIKNYTFASTNPARITSSSAAISSFGLSKRSSWIVEPQLSYERKSGDHTLSIVGGASWQQADAAYQLVYGYGYTSDVLLESLRGATRTNYVQDNNTQYRYEALWGRIGYNYQQKYVVNLTGRRDGSSRFGPDRRWGNFGSAAAAWIFSQERFMRGLAFLSSGKLRASYGITGSDQVGDYSYLSRYGYMRNLYQGQVSLRPSGLSNADYAWEATRKLELGLELSFLKNRINMEVIFYRNRCSNQLLGYNLPGSTGFSSVTVNLPATVQNKGWELILHTVNWQHGSFEWTTDLNITIPKNKLLSYPGIEHSAYADRYVVGMPLTIQKVFHYLGVNPTTGFYEVEDVNKDGYLDQEDLIVIKDVSRKFYGGLNNSFRWKGIELAFLAQFSRQTSFGRQLGGWSMQNMPQEVYEQRWQHPGDKALYQKVTTDYRVLNALNNATSSDADYLDNSFIRIKTATLGYVLPQPVLKKLSLKACKVYIQVQNLYTLSTHDLVDPEVENSSIAPLRMIMGGLEIKL